VDVSHKGEKISFLIAENGFITVFEQMARSPMTAIVILSIPGEEFSHEGRDPGLTASDQKMKMGLHECPSIY
jgi:hypothetical protein